MTLMMSPKNWCNVSATPATCLPKIRCLSSGRRNKGRSCSFRISCISSYGTCNHTPITLSPVHGLGCKHRCRQDFDFRCSGSRGSQEQGVPCFGSSLLMQPLIMQHRRSTSSLCKQAHINFLKPVQTGFPEDSDARLVVCVGSLLK